MLASRLVLAVPLASLLALTGCSGDDGSAGSGGSAASAGAGGGGGGGTGGSSSLGGSSGAGGSAGAGAGSLGSTFRFGINGGNRNKSWNDAIQADLEAAAGCNSQRISLPERHLDQWGYDIELADMQHYASVGMKEQVAFLTSPIREHSTAPSSAADWELAHYLPKNLYEPITLPSGEVNPDNYWAKYVYETVIRYKPWIRVWEIWNEPDWVSSWQVTTTWSSAPPLAKDLPRFNGSIYDYVRMLRVSSVAAKLADPDAKIATGGIGYATFLSAILRYTDNPIDGSVTTEHPATGAAYVDVVSFHHYPIYTPGSSDAAVQGYLDHKAELDAELAKAGKVVAGFETTESGAPHVAVPNNPGGADYAKNYLMKLMTLAPAAGVHGVDWFVLSDGATPGGSNDPYDFMGLYLDVVALGSPNEAVHTDTGRAYATLKALLGGAKLDHTRTASLGLSSQVRGAAFVTAQGKDAVVLWAVAAGSDETGSASFELPASAAMLAHDWDYSLTKSHEELVPVGGKIGLALDSTPRILVEK